MKSGLPRGVTSRLKPAISVEVNTPRGAPTNRRQAGKPIFGLVLFLKSWLILVLVLSLLALGCSFLDFRLPALGKAGKYRTAKKELAKPRGAGTTIAVPLLEDLVKQDPFYRDALTLLGRGYYQQNRYSAVLQILERAVLVNNEDEIAWLLLGLTQLRLGNDQQGLESFKGGLSLLNKKATKHGYRGYESWDVNKLVRAAIRRAIFQVQKEGLDNKERLIRAGELILYRIDEEVFYQQGDALIEEQRDS